MALNSSDTVTTNVVDTSDPFYSYHLAQKTKHQAEEARRQYMLTHYPNAASKKKGPKGFQSVSGSKEQDIGKKQKQKHAKKKSREKVGIGESVNVKLSRLEKLQRNLEIPCFTRIQPAHQILSICYRWR